MKGFLVISIVFSLSIAAHAAAGIPFVTCDRTTSVPFAIIPRGGGQEEDKAIVGVLDLRPDGKCDSIVSSSSSSFGTFPESSYDDDVDEVHAEEALDLQSASAQTVGTLCDSVFLLIAYDPNGERGTTVLQRTAGVKLAAVMNGIRQRFLQEQEKTKLTLILVDVTSVDAPKGDINHDEENTWDRSGALVLVDRLREFFVMGLETKEGDNDVDKDPFQSVDIIPLGGENASEMIQTLLPSSGTNDNNSIENKDETVAFSSLVQRTYKTMGGVDPVSFDARDVI